LRSLHGISLNQQGIILVSFLLLLEMLFVGSLWTLLMQTETEARREEHAKEIGRRTNALIKSLFIVGTSIESYIATKSKSDIDQYESSRRESVDALDWLTVELKDDSQEKQRLDRINGTIREALVLYSQLVRDTRSMPVDQAVEVLRSRKLEFQAKFNRLASDMVQLINQERIIQETSPKNQRNFRSRSRTILEIGLVVNIVMALLIGLFFTRTIGARLKVILDNTSRLSRRQPLNDKLGGEDELSLLDSAFHNMSERLIRDEAMLQASERRVRAVIEQLPVGLLILAHDETIEFANSTLRNMIAARPGTPEIVGRHVNTLFANPSAGLPLQKLQVESFPATAKVVELDLIKANGEKLPVEFSLAKFSDGLEARSERELNLAILLDVSERRAIQNIRQAFVSTVSHELRTPLTSIGGFISLLLAGQYGVFSSEATKEAEMAERNMSRLMRLVGDLLDLEKMESGTIPISPVPCLLSQILRDAINAVGVLAKSREVSLESNYPEIELVIDADRIAQVLINLLSNAIKFSNAGQTVQIKATERSNEIEVQVIDKGRGVPSEFKEAIFERFQQVESDDSKTRGGTGLGLAIAKAIVERHHGKIGVESKPGEGSTFWFTLPCDNDDD
jgi:signal transduction histidine kinase